MIQELIAIGKQVGSGLGHAQRAYLEAFVQKEEGKLYLLDLYPEEKRARLVPYDLDEEKTKKFLPVEVYTATISSLFAGRSEEGKGEYGTFGKDHRVHYALIAFWGR